MRSRNVEEFRRLPDPKSIWLPLICLTIIALGFSSRTAGSEHTSAGEPWVGRWEMKSVYEETEQQWPWWFEVIKNGDSFSIRTHTSSPAQIVSIDDYRLHFVINDELGTVIRVTRNNLNEVTGTIDQPNNTGLPHGQVIGKKAEQDSSSGEVRWISWETINKGSPGSAEGTIRINDEIVKAVYQGELITVRAQNFWVPSDAYLSDQVSNRPISDVLVLQGGSGTRNTIKFSRPVLSPVMALMSLGQADQPITYVFDQPNVILSSGQGYWGNGQLRKQGNSVQGEEGHGVIQFQGEVSEISWTVPESEYWHGFTIGVPISFPERKAEVPGKEARREVNLSASSFDIESEGKDGNVVLKIRATITNDSREDVSTESLVRLSYSQVETESRSGGPWQVVAYSPTIIKRLRGNEKVDLSWSTDKRTPTGGKPFVPDSAVALMLEVDATGAISETNEDDNRLILHRRCIPSDVDDHKLPTNREWVKLDDLPVERKAETVLCNIKKKAKQLASGQLGSARNSDFYSATKSKYLDDYLKRPGISKGEETVREIGAPRRLGLPGSGLITLFGIEFEKSNKIWVPKGFRAGYGNEIPEKLTIATNVLFELKTPVAPFGSTVMDVPFLLGINNLKASESWDDWQLGGKNWSNVMHWATGVSYSNLPEDAMRELFVGYEFWHMEGFDTFGQDAINDLIAEEQGRLFGAIVRSGRISNNEEMVEIFDNTFLQSRAWVGAVLNYYNENRTSNGRVLDLLALKKESQPTNYWFRGEGRTVRPWGVKADEKSIVQQLEAGRSITEASESPLAGRLIEVYRLMYEAKAWEKSRGKIKLSNVLKKTLEGRYNNQFKRAPKEWDATWSWTP